MRIRFALVAVACGQEDPPPFVPACAADEIDVEVAPPDGQFGALEPRDPLFCGIPPQGGAPYTPLRFRAVGPESLGEGVAVRVTAVDSTSAAVLGDTALELGVVCANAGESAGYWTAAEVHLRYEGWSTADLDGRQATIELTVEPAAGGAPAGRVAHDVVLDCP